MRQSMSSLRASLRSLTKSQIRQLIQTLPTASIELLQYEWELFARDKQLAPPGNWRTWLPLAGRGFGKTRMGAEWIRTQVEGDTPLGPGKVSRIALIGETSADARDVMINGESGIRTVSPPDFRPTYIANRKALVWPNGTEAKVFSGIEPDQLRGPQFEIGWVDELCKFQYPTELWDMFQMGLRLGDNPRSLVTTTPRPLQVLKDIVSDPTTVVVKGSTYENAGNLAESFIRYVKRKYEGTRLGRQELHADILGDVQGALWGHSQIDSLRVDRPANLNRIVVAVDPPATSGENADECGIIVAGVSGSVRDNTSKGFILSDDSIHMASPKEWAQAVIDAYKYWGANCIVAEVNQGGEMVETILRNIMPNIPYKSVRAKVGKVARAEPVAALYEQERVFHVGTHGTLEDQMAHFTVTGLDDKTKSPDRVDALVYALTELMLEELDGPSILDVI